MRLESALENPGAKRVLLTLLQRQYGLTDRSRPPMLKLDGKRMPEFGPSRRAGEADEAWEALKAIEAEGLVRIDPLAEKHGYALYELGPVVRLVVDQAPRACELVGFVVERDPWAKEWAQACLAADWLPGEVREQLAERPHRVGERPPTVVLAHWRGLLDGRLEALYVREAAAAIFWGLSKALDERLDLVNLLRHSAGLTPFLESPIQVSIHVIDGRLSAGVLFIENQTAFESAKRGRIPAAKGLDLVFSAGFKASASRLRDERTTSLYPSDSSDRNELERFRAWLYTAQQDVPTYFWGDLDYAALWILKGLRSVFPGMTAWRPGYEFLVDQVRCGNGHLPAEDLHKGDQRPLDATGCAYADQVLLPAIFETGLFCDQEGAVSSGRDRQQPALPHSR